MAEAIVQSESATATVEDLAVTVERVRSMEDLVRGAASILEAIRDCALLEYLPADPGAIRTHERGCEMIRFLTDRFSDFVDRQRMPQTDWPSEVLDDVARALRTQRVPSFRVVTPTAN